MRACVFYVRVHRILSLHMMLSLSGYTDASDVASVSFFDVSVSVSVYICHCLSLSVSVSVFHCAEVFQFHQYLFDALE